MPLSTHSITRIARTPISACRFVDVTSAHTASAAAAIGISEQAAGAGEAFTVVTYYSAPVETAEALAVGDLVKPAADGSGRAVKGAAGDCCGRVMEAATAGKLAEIRFLDIPASAASGGGNGSAGLSSATYDASNRVTSYATDGVTYTVTYPPGKIQVTASTGGTQTINLDSNGRIASVVAG
ncbi:hypothetical protein HNP55_003539 [Paucibacter oligotrophus]|uniref:Uncharacterized protein n=1 Tax=Roseateles oligotrophus TaxID=1769250 RepID=A0A840LEA5_9BURK|nr:capsid cement protein [Roseateles oligotrophus]MBB4844993.1 hypothetical protein [Roseateles oligotrophus]